MNLPNKRKIYIISIAVLLVYTIISACHANTKNLADNLKTPNILTKQIYYFNKDVCIKLKTKPPEDLKEQRNTAFKILQPVLSKDISIASVLWQGDDFSFGKKASISSVYILDFLNNRISTENFVNHISIQLIEPKFIRKNIVEPAIILQIPYENTVISAKLREKANIYRIDGNNESALRIYNQSIKLNPNDYISMYWIGEIYKNQKQNVSAKEYFTKALSLSPDFKSADDALYEIINNDKTKY